MKKLMLIFPVMLSMMIAFTSCGEKKEPAKDEQPSKVIPSDDQPADDQPAEDENIRPENSHSVGTVTDICGNEYNYIKIGNQFWMAENLRCNKYDTQSGQSGNTIENSDVYKFAPYYVDASDGSGWNNASKQTSENLSSTQVKLLGYLYNWAAAVGLATETEAKQKEPFSGNRQGICPNGWHIPTLDEFESLRTFIENEKGADVAGTHLKTTSGWCETSYNYKAGADTYGFAALPAGVGDGNSVGNVGFCTYFWSASPYQSHSSYAHLSQLYVNSSKLEDNYIDKKFASSVRCVKNQIN